jgi:hypothetical protein
MPLGIGEHLIDMPSSTSVETCFRTLVKLLDVRELRTANDGCLYNFDEFSEWYKGLTGDKWMASLFNKQPLQPPRQLVLVLGCNMIAYPSTSTSEITFDLMEAGESVGSITIFGFGNWVRMMSKFKSTADFGNMCIRDEMIGKSIRSFGHEDKGVGIVTFYAKAIPESIVVDFPGVGAYVIELPCITRRNMGLTNIPYGLHS